jgi:hypothetical protein
MKNFKSILEDLYTSEYKVKKWVDPVTGKTKERKVRPHRVEFDASKLRGEPAQKDAQGDYGMKEETMNEQATVKTQKYSWGTMKTIHKGASYSIPLHPEHHEHIAKMKDGQVHDIKTEDGRQWHVKREGDTVHFHGANGGPKTSVPHSSLKEEVESIEEQLLEVLSKDAKAGEWISDFVKSDNPKFEGKSKKERIKMALGAYYGKQNESLEEGYIVKYHDAKGVHKNTSKVFDDKAKADAHASKGNSIDKVGGKYSVHKIDSEGRSVNEGVNDRPKSTEVKSTAALAPMGKSTSGASIKDSSGVAHSAMSRARRLARLALGKKSTNEAKETYKGLEKEDKKGLPTAMIKKSEKAVEGDTVEGWDHPHDAVKEEVQKVDVPAYLRKAKGEKPLELKDLKRKDTISDAENLKKATGVKEEVDLEEQAPVAPVLGQKWKNHAVMVNTQSKSRVTIDRKHIGNYPEHEGWKEVAPGQKLKEGSKLSFGEFSMMLEYEVDKNGKYVHKGTYGSSFAKAEREKDEEGFESEPKAKRGPKMGSKRGAKANYGSSKLHTK